MFSPGIFWTSRKLRIPKSSVSRSVTRLEAETVISLFERSTRHFRLTDAGAALRPYAERAVHDLEEAQTALEDIGGELRGVLRVNTTPAFAQELVGPMLPALMPHHPHLRVELHTDPHTIDLVREGIDLAIRIGALPDSSLVAKRLPSISRWMVASPAYLAQRGAPADLSELVDHDLVTREAISQWTLATTASNAQSRRADGLSSRRWSPEGRHRAWWWHWMLAKLSGFHGHPGRGINALVAVMAAPGYGHPCRLPFASQYVGEGAYICRCSVGPLDCTLVILSKGYRRLILSWRASEVKSASLSLTSPSWEHRGQP